MKMWQRFVFCLCTVTVILSILTCSVFAADDVINTSFTPSTQFYVTGNGIPLTAGPRDSTNATFFAATGVGSSKFYVRHYANFDIKIPARDKFIFRFNYDAIWGSMGTDVTLVVDFVTASGSVISRSVVFPAEYTGPAVRKAYYDFSLSLNVDVVRISDVSHSYDFRGSSAWNVGLVTVYPFSFIYPGYVSPRPDLPGKVTDTLNEDERLREEAIGKSDDEIAAELEGIDELSGEVFNIIGDSVNITEFNYFFDDMFNVFGLQYQALVFFSLVMGLGIFIIGRRAGT